jgi:vacuolar-type H+-ATPase subunit I/STV1
MCTDLLPSQVEGSAGAGSFQSLIALRSEASMPFTVEEFRDLVRILEERPEWRAELRRLVLTDEILTLPALIRELIEAQRRTEQRVATIEEQLAALIEAQQRTEQEIGTLVEVQRRAEQRIGTLTNDMADVKGVVLELRYHHRAHAYFAPLIRRTHVLSGEEIETLLEGAVAQGLLSEAEADEILLADLLLRGRRRADHSEVYVVVEISWKIDPYDVERSVRRAALLSRIGTPAVPVVAGKEVIEEAASLASMLHVWQLTNGQAIPPHQPGSANDQSPSHA